MLFDLTHYRVKIDGVGFRPPWSSGLLLLEKCQNSTEGVGFGKFTAK